MLSRLIYINKKLCSDEQISVLLEDARAFNARNGVSGALYLSNGDFMQSLEGNEEVLSELWTRIQQDSRTTDRRLLDHRFVDMRIFKKWSME